MSLSISDLFDENFYLEKNPDVVAAIARKEFGSGLEHYLRFGASEGRDPSIWFNNSTYLRLYPDVAQAIATGFVTNGISHFLQYGQHEQRTPVALFDPNYYVSLYSDVKEAIATNFVQSAYEHYRKYGHREERIPSSQFHGGYYTSAYTDVKEAIAAGLASSSVEHYLKIGQSEGRQSSPSTFDIQLDYRFDTNGFFADPNRRNTLEAAARFWEARIQDEFDDVPAGIPFQVQNPQTGQLETVVLSGIDDLTIFVGAQTTPFAAEADALAAGGPDGLNVVGSVFAARFKGSDFEPWIGSISFSNNPTFADGTPAPWFFDQTPTTGNDIPPGYTDFLSTALHEIAHVLGVGSAPIFRQLGATGSFRGPNAIAANGGVAVPLEPGLGHIQDGFLYNGQPVLMGPTSPGVRQTITQLDAALLADIGYQIAGFQTQGSTLAIATAGNDSIFGTVVADALNGLEGNDQIQGDAGNDVLNGEAGDDLLFGQSGDDTLLGGSGNDQLVGGDGNDLLIGGPGNDTLFGGGGVDTFQFEGNNGSDTIGDFIVAEDTIIVASTFGFSSGASVLGAITRRGSSTTGGLFSVVTLNPENTITVFHDTPLTEQDFLIS